MIQEIQSIADRRQSKLAEKASPQQICIILQGAPKKTQNTIAEFQKIRTFKFVTLPPLGGIAKTIIQVHNYVPCHMQIYQKIA